MDPDPDPRKEIEVDPDPDLDPEQRLKWIRIRPNAVDSDPNPKRYKFVNSGMKIRNAVARQQTLSSSW